MTLEAPPINFYYNHLAIPAFDDAALLYYLRRSKITQQRQGLQNIVEIDQRLKKNIDHLQLFAEMSQEICRERYDLEDESDAFVATALSFIHGDKNWIQEVLQIYLSEPHTAEAVAIALAWLPWESSGPWIKLFLSSKDLQHKWLAIAVCSLAQKYPQEEVQKLIAREDCLQDVRLLERLLRLIGQMKDSAKLEVLRQASCHDDVTVRTRACWSRLLIGDDQVIARALEISLTDNDTFHTLSPMLILRLSMAEGRDYMSSVISSPDIALDLKILAIAYHGDTVAVPWLLSQIKDTQSARCVSYALMLMLGIEIDEQGLAIEEESSTEEDSEKEYFFDEDFSLPILDANKFREFWKIHHSRFQAKQRYFLGELLIPANEECMARIQKYAASDINIEHAHALLILALHQKSTPYGLFVQPRY